MKRITWVAYPTTNKDPIVGTIEKTWIDKDGKMRIVGRVYTSNISAYTYIDITSRLQWLLICKYRPDSLPGKLPRDIQKIICNKISIFI